MRRFLTIGLLCAAVAAGCGPAADRSPAPRRHSTSRPAGTLYLANATPGRLTTVDALTGRVRERSLAKLAPGDPPYMIAVAGRRLVVYGHDHTYAYGLGLREPPRDLGKSWFFVPSATAGRVWLALLDPRSPRSVNALSAVREVTVGGRTTASHGKPPPRWPLAALRNGLVLQRRTLALWDPATGRITQRLPGVFPVAAHDSRLLSCAMSCGVLRLSNTQTGGRNAIRLRRGQRFAESYDGAFSRDGKLAAVPARDGRGRPRVALVDLARRTAALVPGPRLADDYPLMAWSASGWLFYNAGRGRIAAYRRGHGGATILPVHVRPFVDIAAR